jgi:hypothetical protein
MPTKTDSTGVICAFMVPSIITRFPGHQIFSVSMIAFLLGNLLAAVNPAGFGYWPLLVQVSHPAATLRSLGANETDLSFATGQLIVSNSVDREFQGVAGNLIHWTVLTFQAVSSA